MKRLPRKLKKDLKKKFKKRYGFDWLKCGNLLIEYKWFYKNPLNYNMDKTI